MSSTNDTRLRCIGSDEARRQVEGLLAAHRSDVQQGTQESAQAYADALAQATGALDVIHELVALVARRQAWPTAR